MLKRVFSMALLLMCAVAMNAQQMPQPVELPLDPAVKAGVLPNGMHYYVLHNEEPKGRANFYIAQKVGSALEEQNQLGLAHFLEHMAFNGTKNYPGKNMLNYLQSKGIRLGADINAYTSFDETVYNVNNVPCADEALMDSVLLVLHDWSCDILLEEDEINSERNVIQEEWRSRSDANDRLRTAMFPAVFEEYQYARMPIGTMDVVMNFPPDDLRAYYKKWYRPDQQGIVVVGDFDADVMEQKIIKLFSEIPMPENAAERTYAPVSDNEKPIYFTFEDPELNSAQIMVFFKRPTTPFEYRNTDINFTEDMMFQVFCGLINNRLTEAASEPNCNFAYAGVSMGNYFMAKTKDAFSIYVVPKGEMLPAYQEALAIVSRACKTGFTDSELERVNSEILANYDKLYNEREKTDSENRGREIIRHFIDNEPTPGIEIERMLVQALLPQLPAAAYNMIGASVMTPTNQVIVAMQPKTETSQPLPTEEVMTGTLAEAMAQEYEAYVDEKITEPLIAKMRKKGSIVAQNTNEDLGTTELTLSNGVKVIVKTTDFAADEINVKAFRLGGKESYPASDAANILSLGDAYDNSKLGAYDTKMMRKYLAGKKVSLGYGVNATTTAFDGSSTVKDLPTLMELIYASFTSVGKDKNAFEATISSMRSVLANYENNPMMKFQREVSNTLFCNNQMMLKVPTLEMLDQINYDKCLDIIKKSTANAAEYTFVFVGNVDVETLRPLLEQYIASLPAKKKVVVPPVINPIKLAAGKVVNAYDQPMDTPSTTFIINFNGSNLEPTIENSVNVDLLGDILSNVYTETIREEEGGAYSPYAYGNYLILQKHWMVVGSVQTNSDMQDKMLKRAKDEFVKLINEGATIDQFNKVRGAALNQYEISVRTNGYWESNIMYNQLGYNLYSGHKAAIENLTLEQFNAWMKNLWNGEDLIEIIMTGVPAK